MLKFCVAERAPPALESVTLTVKLDVPTVVGVPVIAPAPVKVRPAGRLPVLTVNASVPAPPVTAIVWLYDIPTMPFWSVATGITGGSVKLMVRVVTFEVLALDVAVIVAVGSTPEANETGEDFVVCLRAKKEPTAGAL
jgi:hypothetical protein